MSFTKDCGIVGGMYIQHPIMAAWNRKTWSSPWIRIKLQGVGILREEAGYCASAVLVQCFPYLMWLNEADSLGVSLQERWFLCLETSSLCLGKAWTGNSEKRNSFLRQQVLSTRYEGFTWKWSTSWTLPRSSVVFKAGSPVWALTGLVMSRNSHSVGV